MSFEPVKVRSPGGDLHTARSPRELNDLLYGHGYTVVGKRGIADVAPAGVSPEGEPQTVTDSGSSPKPRKENTGG